MQKELLDVVEVACLNRAKVTGQTEPVNNRNAAVTAADEWLQDVAPAEAIPATCTSFNWF